MANTYHCKPSEILNVKDEYTAFCLDEACVYIIKQLEDGKKPVFKRKVKSFKELYANY